MQVKYVIPVLSIILLTQIVCDAGLSKLKLGNKFFANLLALGTKTIILEANKHKDSLPPFDIDLSPTKYTPLTVGLFNIHYEELKYQEHQFELDHNKDEIITVKINNLRVTLKSDFKDKFLFFPEKQGTIELDLVFSTEANLKLSLTKEKFISLSLDSISITHEFNSLKIDSGFLVKFIGTHIGWFKSLINWSLEKIISKTLKNALTNLNKNLQKQIGLPSLDLLVGIKMENMIIFADDYFEVELNLDIESKKELDSINLKEAKGKSLRKITKRNSPTNEKIEISLDKNLINTFVQFSLKNNRTISITNDMIPSQIPFKINTVYFHSLIPEMYDKYPDKDLIITIDIDSFPLVNMNSTIQEINTDINIAITFAIKDDPNTPILSLSTGANLSIVVDSNVEDRSIHVQVRHVVISNVFVLVSTIGEVNADKIKNDGNDLLSSLLYFVNNYLRVNPIPIPIIPGLKFDSIKISITETNFLSLTVLPDFNSSNLDWLCRK